MIKIRRITTPEDRQAVAALAQIIWEEYYTPIIGAAQVAYMLSAFQSAEAIAQQMLAGYRYAAAYVHDCMAGYCAVKMDKPQAKLWLSKLYVEKTFRKQGIANALLDFCLSEVEPRVQCVWLTVNKNNAEAIAAYRRMGFVISGSVVNDIGCGFVMDDFIMERVN